MSVSAIRQNKLRSVLSVLGITIGIYCIVAVYALVHSLEININQQFTKYGTNVLFVQKWPWDEFGGNYPWWKYLSRPVSAPQEAQFLESKLSKERAANVAYNFDREEKVSASGVTLDGTRVVCISHGFMAIQDLSVEDGRLFTLEESNTGQPVAILGSTIAQQLFGGGRGVGSTIRIGNRVCRVIGICATEKVKTIHIEKNMSNARMHKHMGNDLPGLKIRTGPIIARKEVI